MVASVLVLGIDLESPTVLIVLVVLPYLGIEIDDTVVRPFCCSF